METIKIEFTNEQLNEVNAKLNSLPISHIDTVQELFKLLQTGVNQAIKAAKASKAEHDVPTNEDKN